MVYFHPIQLEVTTSSGRRVKRKNLDDYGDSSIIHNRRRKSKSGRKASKKKSSSKSLRPQRAAARNALHLFSRITGTSTDGEDEYSTEGDSSESVSILEESNVASEGSDLSLQQEQREPSKGKEILVEKSEGIDRLDRESELHLNAGTKRRLVLKLPNRGSGKFMSARSSVLKGESQSSLAGPSSVAGQRDDEKTYSQDLGQSAAEANGEKTGSQMVSTAKAEYYLDLLEDCKDGNISWGGVKARTSKRLRMGESLASVAHAGSSSVPDGHVGTDKFSSGHIGESETTFPKPDIQNGGDKVNETLQRNEAFTVPGAIRGAENVDTDSCLGDARDYEKSPSQFHQVVGDRPVSSDVYPNGKDSDVQLSQKPSTIPTKLRIKSRLFASDREGPSKVQAESPMEDPEQNAFSALSDSVDFKNKLDPDIPLFCGSEVPKSDSGSQDGMQEADNIVDKSSALLDFHQLPLQNRMFNAVYRRSKSSKCRSNQQGENGRIETSTSALSNHNLNHGIETATEGVRRTRSIRLRTTTHDSNAPGRNSNFRDIHNGSLEAQICSEKASVSKDADNSGEEWRTDPSISVRPRSTRNRRGSSYVRDCSPSPDRRKLSQSVRNSWLMLSTHEVSRYIPQQGDEVVYLRQVSAVSDMICFYPANVLIYYL